MIKVNFSYPWRHNFFLDRTPNGAGVFHECEFDFSGNADAADAWIVWGDLMPDREIQRLSVYPGSLWYVTDEAHNQKSYHPKFLAQFDRVLSLRNDVPANNHYYIHELNTWLMPLSYDDAIKEGNWPKSKIMSLVSSNLTDLPGHRQRFELVKMLQREFPNEIDFYGRGINPIDSKLDALSSYKYSIAIENNSIPGYFTEKLTECFLTETLPLYFGCPNITNFFPSDAIVPIDINDPASVIASIRAILKNDPYQNHVAALREAKKEYLKRFHIFAAIANLLTQDTANFGKAKVRRTVKSHRSFHKDGIVRRIMNRIIPR